MSFCTKCGAQAPDGTKFCPSCGTPMAVATAPTPQQPVYNQAPQGQPMYTQAPQQPVYSQAPQGQPVYGQMPQQPMYNQAPKKKSKAPLIASLSIVAVLAIAAVLIFVVFKPFGKGASSFKQALQRYMDAWNERSVDDVVDICFADAMMKELVKEGEFDKKSEVKDYFKELIEPKMDIIEEHDVEIVDFDIEDKDPMSRSEIDEYFDDFADKIKEATVLTVWTKQEGINDGETTTMENTSDFVAYKCKGRWYIMDKANE